MVKQKNYVIEILALLEDDKRKLPSMIIMFMAISILDFVGLAMVAPYINLFVNKEKTEEIVQKIIEQTDILLTTETFISIAGIILISFFLIKTIVSLWNQYKITKFSENQRVKLQTKLMQSYQSLEYKEYLERNSAEYIHTIQTKVSHYVAILSTILKTISDSLIVVAIVVYLAWQNIFVLTLLLVLLGSAILLYDKSFRKKLGYYGMECNKASKLIVQSINESMTGFKELKILKKETYFLDKLKKNAKIIGNNATKQKLIQIAPGYLMEFILIFFAISLIYISSKLNDDITEILPTISVFGLAALRLKPIAYNLSSSLSNMHFMRNSVKLLHRDFIKIKSSNKLKVKEKQKNEIHLQKKDVFKNLELKKVSYAYNETTKDILNEITLEIKAGESIGIIGKSGSGKTTLIDILIGLLEIKSGEIRYNNQNITTEFKDWQSEVAYLPQEVFLIDNSLKVNIALEEDINDIKEIKIKEALRKSRLIELVTELPQGLNTMLGENGMRLSGGQRQRIALARAFYNEKNVLIMDEATSALDTSTEKEIVDEIQFLKGKLTMIVIAHRQNIVENCDSIYKIERGNLIKIK